MKNITVSVPEDVYRAARVRAAEDGSSVSAMVTHYLRSLEARESEFSRLEALQGRVLAEIEQFRGANRLSRDQLHDRAIR